MSTARDESFMHEETAALRRWLFDAALPLWWEVGADRAHGGFHERIDLDGRPVAMPRRARSITRQAFCYCEAGRLGWTGPWREAAMHALDYVRRYFVTGDGTVVSAVDLDGAVSNPTFDLYEQAFALLAYAGGHRCFGEAAGWRGAAFALRAALERRYAHPQGGFHEDRDRRLPLRSNPHMHLLESALAWLAIDHDPQWRVIADGIARLALERFIDPATGALRELFATDWSPAPGIEGEIAEPGHQYEWAFLLDRWARLTDRAAPAAIDRLIKFADAHGLDRQRGVAINAVLLDGRPHDPVARLWPQTERIKAYLIDRSAANDAHLADAVRGLRRYLDTPKQGLWLDRLAANNRFIVEPARATNLYHIVGAVAELSAAFGEAAD